MWLMLSCAALLYAQNIEDYWLGNLNITANQSLSLGMLITQQGDSVQLLLDSPDQYAMGIPASEVRWKDSVLFWKAASLSAQFSGKLSADGQSIVGTFKQGAGKLPLTLTRGHERKVFNRPQALTSPYPYTEEEIRIKDANGKYNLINGTLTMPESKPKALVILITGSGWQNRDEEIFGHKPFALIADYLTRQGYAVFRYDDFPKAIFAKCTTFDFADGVTMILDSFSRRADLAAVPVGLLGHSEGSIVASIVASRNRDVAFTIHLGGVAQPVPDVLLYQLRALNAAEGKLTAEEIECSAAVSANLYDKLRKAKTAEKAATELDKRWDEQMAKMTPEQQQRLGMTAKDKMTTIAQMSSPWYFAFFKLDPKKYLKKVHCPVLAIGGEKDLQVDAVSNNLLFEKYLPVNEKHEFVVEPNANHLLQPCTTGSSSEYGQIEMTMKPEVLERISKWLQRIL